MAFTVPVSKNYVNPVVAVPLDWTEQPLEGPMGIQCSITWNATESGANKSVLVNAQNLSTRPFTKLRTLVIDNSANGSDVQIIFPDTETTMSIPAYTPYAVIPCFTNGTSFYITSPNALATDKTAFMVLNTLPPPIAVPTTQEQNAAVALNIGATVSGNYQLVPAGTNGTLELYQLTSLIVGAAGIPSIAVTLADGNGQVVAFGGFGGNPNASSFGVLDNLPDLRIRFQNGLVLSWVTLGAPTSLTLTANAYYRTP